MYIIGIPSIAQHHQSGIRTCGLSHCTAMVFDDV
jgi:hypothetical protein